MCKLIKRIICLLMVALIVFFVIALWSGGEKFRWLGKKTGGIVEHAADKLGNKADEIKRKKDAAASVLKKLTGATSSEKSSQKTSKPQKNSDESEDNGTTAASERDKLKNIMEKLKALIKG